MESSLHVYKPTEDLLGTTLPSCRMKSSLHVYKPTEDLLGILANRGTETTKMVNFYLVEVGQFEVSCCSYYKL